MPVVQTGDTNVVQLMPQPWKHPKSAVYYFRKVVPGPLRVALGRTEYRISLGTKDLPEAKRRYPAVATKVDAELAQAAGGPTILSQQQIVALAGLWYRRELEANEANPGDPDDRDIEVELLQEAYEKGKAREAVAWDVNELLKAEGLTITEPCLEELANSIFWLKLNLIHTLKRRGWGDYSRDPKLDTFPSWEAPQSPTEVTLGKPSGDTFTTLLEAWKIERKPGQRTADEWERAIGRLEAHVGHDVPARLTKAAIVGWKDALIGEGKAGKTVGNHLRAVGSLFNWAVSNERLIANPAKGVVVAGKGKGSVKRLPYTDEDAKTLLLASRTMAGARRWLPWLLAFTGARVEEVCQSFVSDIRHKGGIWHLDINADHPSKSLKNTGSVRCVPLHASIISEGFLSYVSSLPQDGPLFPDLKPDKYGRRGDSATDIMGRWVRKLGITDPRIAPNHSWRHRFKDECRNVEIDTAIHDALTGHSPSGEGGKYGVGYSLSVLAMAVAKLPSPVPSGSISG